MQCSKEIHKEIYKIQSRGNFVFELQNHISVVFLLVYSLIAFFLLLLFFLELTQHEILKKQL